MKILCLLALIPLTGCMGSKGISEVAEALADDNATITVDIPTPYGMAKIVRTNPGTNHSSAIMPDGTVSVTREP